MQSRLEAALRREAVGQHSAELHAEESRALLDFDRHSAVPELQPASADGGGAHVFALAST